MRGSWQIPIQYNELTFLTERSKFFDKSRPKPNNPLLGKWYSVFKHLMDYMRWNCGSTTQLWYSVTCVSKLAWESASCVQFPILPQDYRYYYVIITNIYTCFVNRFYTYYIIWARQQPWKTDNVFISIWYMKTKRIWVIKGLPTL